ncbi:MAG: hypothetical protein ACI4IO_05020 [Eubacterium sp.]
MKYCRYRRLCCEHLVCR